MRVSRVASWAAVVLITAAISWTTQAVPSAQQPAAGAAAQPAAPGANRQAEFGTFPSREFIRLKLIPARMPWCSATSRILVGPLKYTRTSSGTATISGP